MNLAGAKALVTGGSSGIGLETARQLRGRGAQVAICGRDRNNMQRAAEEIGALAIHADVSVEADVVRMVRTVVDSFGRERPASKRKLRSLQIAQTILSMLELDDRGFITETSVWATNPD